MLRMYQFKSGREMKDYYTAALAGGDYYLAEEKHSRWRGDLAKRLGLSEHVTQETFASLADNLHPLTGKDLTPRTNADRTNGYDINFSVPKSVSLVHAVTKDDRILTALRDSMDETMREIERRIQTRVRIGGKDENREANGLVWAEFLHSVEHRRTPHAARGFGVPLHDGSFGARGVCGSRWLGRVRQGPHSESVRCGSCLRAV